MLSRASGWDSADLLSDLLSDEKRSLKMTYNAVIQTQNATSNFLVAHDKKRFIKKEKIRMIS